MNSYEYINKIKEIKNLDTDYKVAKLLGCRQTKISNYREGQSMDNETARQVAKILGVSVWKIIADMEIQRLERQDKNEEAQIWYKLRKEAGKATSNLLILNVIFSLSALYYILCKIARHKTGYQGVSAYTLGKIPNKIGFVTV